MRANIPETEARPSQEAARELLRVRGPYLLHPAVPVTVGRNFDLRARGSRRDRWTGWLSSSPTGSVASSRLVAIRRRHWSEGLGVLRHVLKRAIGLASLTVIITGLVCRGPDLTVTAKGRPWRPRLHSGRELRSSRSGTRRWRLGDQVPLDQEVPAVMAGLFRGGLEGLAL